jgi:hypothetical protein
MTGLSQRECRAAASALPIAALALGCVVLTGCATRPVAVKNPTGPRAAAVVRPADLGIGIRHLPGGRVAVTGVVGRYPVTFGPADRTTPIWVVFGSLGSETSAPAVLVSINQASEMEASASVSASGPPRGRLPGPVPISRAAPVESFAFGGPSPRLAPHEGKLVTMEGAAPQHALRVEWPALSPDAIKDAPPALQAKVPGLGSVVHPGPWWEKWSEAYFILWGLERYSQNLRTAEAARKAFGMPFAVPDSPAAGPLLGIFARGGRPSERSVTAVFGHDLMFGVFSGDSTYGRYDQAWLARQMKGSTPYPKLVSIAGRKGAIEYYVYEGRHRVPYVKWRDGRLQYLLDYRGPPGMALSEAKLLEVARSAYR